MLFQKKKINLYLNVNKKNGLKASDTGRRTDRQTDQLTG